MAIGRAYIARKSLGADATLERFDAGVDALMTRSRLRAFEHFAAEATRERQPALRAQADTRRRRRRRWWRKGGGRNKERANDRRSAFRSRCRLAFTWRPRQGRGRRQQTRQSDRGTTDIAAAAGQGGHRRQRRKVGGRRRKERVAGHE